MSATGRAVPTVEPLADQTDPALILDVCQKATGASFTSPEKLDSVTRNQLCIASTTDTQPDIVVDLTDDLHGLRRLRLPDRSAEPAGVCRGGAAGPPGWHRCLIAVDATSSTRHQIGR